MPSGYPTEFTYGEEINILIDTIFISLAERDEERFNLTREAMRAHAERYPSTALDRAFEDFDEGALHENPWTRRAYWTADVLHSRFVANNRLEDIEKAINIVEQEDQQASPRSISTLARLGTYHCNKFSSTSDVSDIERAIEALQVARVLVPSAHKARTTILSLLAYCMSMGGLHTSGDLSPEDSITVMALCNELHSLKAMSEQSLGALEAEAMFSKYEASADVGDLDRSIKLYQQTIEPLSPESLERVQYLPSLSAALLARFRHCNTLVDVNTAIDLIHEGVKIDKGSHNLASSLAEAYMTRFNALGDIADLEQCILQCEEAVVKFEIRELLWSQAGPPWPQEAEFEMLVSDGLSRARLLSHLSDSIFLRYLNTRRGPDLKRSVALLREAQRAIPDNALNHRRKDDLLRELALCLALRAPAFLSGSGPRQSSPRALKDIERAISVYRDSVQKIPQEAPERLALVSQYSLLLRTRMAAVDHEPVPEDMLEIIQTYEEVYNAIPLDNEIERSQGSAIVALDWYMYCAVTGETWNHAKGMEIYGLIKTVVRSALARPSDRTSCAALAGSILAYQPEGLVEDGDRWEEAFSMLEQGIELLPIEVPQYSQRSHRHSTRVRGFNLGSLAVASGLNAGKSPYRCLASLEQSRGVILGFTIDCRSTGNLQELRKNNPELVHKFNTLRGRVDGPSEGFPLAGQLLSNPNGARGGSDTYEDLKRRRIKDFDELGKTLQEIRDQPGFERFQLPPSYEQLVDMATDGPIVIEVCSTLRSDAIIVTSSGIKSIPLPNLTYSIARERIEEFNKDIVLGGYRTYRSRSEKMERFLVWLWEAAVEPVIDELKIQGVVGFSSSPDAAKLPRIWWIGTGWLGLVPFHAAGDHSPGSTRNTLSYAISSYIPTLKALSYARENPLTFPTGGDSNLLIISMPETPGHASLLSASMETGSIASLVPKGVRAEILDSPSVKDTLERLSSFDVIHFACHGFSDSVDPFNSHLRLHKGEDCTTGAGRLTAGAVSSINMDRAQIAYLSACSTARITSDDLADESVHIASAFQLAGFSHILANMWPSEDEACLKVSTEFYRSLFDGVLSEAGGGHRNVSTAFHHAVKKLRDENPRLPLLWSPFVHFGA